MCDFPIEIVIENTYVSKLFLVVGFCISVVMQNIMSTRTYPGVRWQPGSREGLGQHTAPRDVLPVIYFFHLRATSENILCLPILPSNYQLSGFSFFWGGVFIKSLFVTGSTQTIQYIPTEVKKSALCIFYRKFTVQKILPFK
jgi:hypothetical protein